MKKYWHRYTKFLITKFLITEFLIAKFLITKFQSYKVLNVTRLPHTKMTFLGPKWHSPIGSMSFHRAQKSLDFQGRINHRSING
jgi:hypothetical protein